MLPAANLPPRRPIGFLSYRIASCYYAPHTRLQVRVAGRADLAAVRPVAAARHQVHAELALGRLHRPGGRVRWGPGGTAG